MEKVLGRLRFRLRALPACLLVAAVAAVPLPVHAQTTVDAKQAEAEALKTRLAEQGRKLSLADEEFNKARLERQRLESQVTSAQALVAASEARWNELRAQLGRRVRLLYMHPGAALDAWLGLRTVSELARAQKLGSSVLTADADLVMQTERARHEVMSRANRLGEIRAGAMRKEQELGARRAEVSQAVSAQQRLLSGVTAEIAELMEAERRAELERAAQEAAAQQEEQAPSPPAIGDRSKPPPKKEDKEPSSPPPAARASAGKAVATAQEQIGKPYEWGAEGPDSFDCSGLTLYAWKAAGVSLPHSSQAQYNSLPKVARKDLQPGDLVFFGSPIHHVGIYEGGGVMINAPETGELVRRNSIGRADYAGAARP